MRQVARSCIENRSIGPGPALDSVDYDSNAHRRCGSHRSRRPSVDADNRRAIYALSKRSGPLNGHPRTRANGCSWPHWHPVTPRRAVPVRAGNRTPVSHPSAVHSLPSCMTSMYRASSSASTRRASRSAVYLRFHGSPHEHLAAMRRPCRSAETGIAFALTAPRCHGGDQCAFL